MDDPRAQPPSMRPVPPEAEDALHGDTMVVNMGPSHPSTHGVLRLVLRLDGEVVKAVQPHVGYLHRGMEKIAEGMTYNQFVPYTDRLDYLAPLSNNVAYILAVEKLLAITVPPRAQVIRVICCEIARISAHLLWLGTGALDLADAALAATVRAEQAGETSMKSVGEARIRAAEARLQEAEAGADLRRGRAELERAVGRRLE